MKFGQPQVFHLLKLMPSELVVALSFFFMAPTLILFVSKVGVKFKLFYLEFVHRYTYSSPKLFYRLFQVQIASVKYYIRLMPIPTSYICLAGYGLGKVVR